MNAYKIITISCFHSSVQYEAIRICVRKKKQNKTKQHTRFKNPSQSSSKYQSPLIQGEKILKYSNYHFTFLKVCAIYYSYLSMCSVWRDGCLRLQSRIKIGTYYVAIRVYTVGIHDDQEDAGAITRCWIVIGSFARFFDVRKSVLDGSYLVKRKKINGFSNTDTTLTNRLYNDDGSLYARYNILGEICSTFSLRSNSYFYYWKFQSRMRKTADRR